MGGGYHRQLRKTVLFGIGVFIILLSIVGLTYAYWMNRETQNTFDVLGVKCFELTMASETEGIYLEEAYPISEEEGKKQQGYTFTIKNTCNTSASYQVNLEEKALEESIKRLNDQYIKVSLNNSTGKNLNTYESTEATIEEEDFQADKSHKLTSGSLGPEEEETYTLKLWMDEETPAIEEVMNATFESKISIVATYMEEEQRKNDITIAYKEQEDYSNESDRITFTATSENKEINIIEYSLDGETYESIELVEGKPSSEVTLSLTFTEEKEYTIYFRDSLGNIKEQKFTPEKLDQTGPEIHVNETSDEKGALLNITFTDLKSGLLEYRIEDRTSSIDLEEEWTLFTKEQEETIEYTSETNKTITIYGKDKFGNISKLEHTITKADTTGPELTIENSSKGTWTNEKVTITIKATDYLNEIDKITYSTDQLTWIDLTVNKEEKTGLSTLELVKNQEQTYYFKAKDKLGNESEVQETIVKIDMNGPDIKSFTTSDEWGSTNTVTGIVEDTLSGIKGYEISTSAEPSESWNNVENSPTTEQTFTKEVTENQTYYLHVLDEAGNTSTKEVEVRKVDTEEPNVIFEIQSKIQLTGKEWYQALKIRVVSTDRGSGVASAKYCIGTSDCEPEEDANLSEGITSRTFDVDFETNELAQKICVEVIDEAGNKKKTCDENTYKVDGTNPMITLNGTTESGGYGTSNTLTSIPTPASTGSGYTYSWYQVPEYHYVSKTDWSIQENQELNGSKYWKVTYNKTSGTEDEWHHIDFPTYSYTVGKTYRIHFKIRVNQIENMTFGVRHSLVYNDHGMDYPSIEFNEVTNGWVEGTLIRTIPNTPYTNEGTIYEPSQFSPRIEIWTGDLKLENGVNSRSVDFDFKDFWVEELDPGDNAKIENNLAVKLDDNNVTKSFENDINAWYVAQIETGSGKIATSNKYQILIDNTLPTNLVIHSTSENVWTNQAVTITITVEDNLSGVDKCYWTWITPENPEWGELDAVYVSENTYKSIQIIDWDFASAIYVKCKDKAGNYSTVIENHGVLVDKGPPSVPELITDKNTWTNTETTLTISVSDSFSGIDKCYWSMDISGNSGWNELDAFYVSENFYTSTQLFNWSYASPVYVKCKDKAGNYSELAENRTVFVDKVPPTQSFQVSLTPQEPNNGWYRIGEVTITGEDSESEIVSGNYCTGINSCIPNIPFIGKTTNVTMITGINSVVCANFTDLAGNTSATTCSQIYIIDSEKPTIDSVEVFYRLLGSASYNFYGYTTDGGVNGTWTTNTPDPQIIFNVSRYKNISSVYLELETPLSTDQYVQVFYSISENFSEENSRRALLPAGTKAIFIDIPTNNYTDLRIDMGETSGLSYKINHLNILADAWTNSDIVARERITENYSGLSIHQYRYENSAYDSRPIENYSDNIYVSKNFTGIGSMFFRIYDIAGNISDEKNFNVNYDNIKPEANFNVSVGDKMITVTDTSTDSGGSGVFLREYQLDSGSWMSSTSNVYNFMNVSIGTHTVSVRVTDAAGNVSAISSTSVKVYYYLYDQGKTNTNIVGSWIPAAGDEIYGQGIGFGDTGTHISFQDTTINIQLDAIDSFVERYNHVVGFRSSNTINTSLYKELHIVYDIYVPENWAYATRTDVSPSLGIVFGTTPNVSGSWHANITGMGMEDFLPGQGLTRYSFDRTADLSNAKGYQYLFFDAAANELAYGASLSWTIRQIYLVPV